MKPIIPRNLIKHLEWDPSKRVPEMPEPPKTISLPSIQGALDVKVDLSKYIQVGINGIHGNPVIISPMELSGFNNLNYENTHLKLIDSGLYMPPPIIFRTHFNNVVEVVNDRKKLLYADGSEVSKDTVNGMYEHFTTNFKNVYGRADVGVWTWLNAKFVNNSYGELNLEIVVGLTTDRNFEVRQEPLDAYLGEDTYVDLAFNTKGLSTTKSANQKYSKGNNIYFYQPRENKVAGFGASSDGAGLYCDGDPSIANPALGVFACAEGTAQKNGGGE